MDLDPLHPRVIEAYKDIVLRNFIIVDVLYESYLERRRKAQQEAASGNRRIISHFSMREDEVSLYELFDDSDEDDEFNSERVVDEDDG